MAYSNPFAGATTTTLYAINQATSSLAMIGGINGTPSPNVGVVTDVGPLGVSITAGPTAFDIATNNTAFAVLRPSGGASTLYTISLATGAATPAGTVGDGTTTFDDIAVVDPGLILSPPSGTYTSRQNFDIVLLADPQGRSVTERHGALQRPRRQRGGRGVHPAGRRGGRRRVVPLPRHRRRGHRPGHPHLHRPAAAQRRQRGAALGDLDGPRRDRTVIAGRGPTGWPRSCPTAAILARRSAGGVGRSNDCVPGSRRHARRARPARRGRSDDHGAASGQRAVMLDEAKGPAVLTVRRTADDDVQDRQVYLSVDGEDWVTLLYGREVTRELGPGPHTLEGQQHAGAQVGDLRRAARRARALPVHQPRALDRACSSWRSWAPRC